MSEDKKEKLIIHDRTMMIRNTNLKRTKKKEFVYGGRQVVENQGLGKINDLVKDHTIASLINLARSSGYQFKDEREINDFKEFIIRPGFDVHDLKSAMDNVKRRADERLSYMKSLEELKKSEEELNSTLDKINSKGTEKPAEE